MTRSTASAPGSAPASVPLPASAPPTASAPASAPTPASAPASAPAPAAAPALAPSSSPSHSSADESLPTSTVTRTEASDSGLQATTPEAEATTRATAEEAPQVAGTTPEEASEWRRAWDAWHEARWATVSAPHGTAALADTVWLSTQEQKVDGIAGRWRADGARVVATGLDGSGYTDAGGAPVGDAVALAGGEELRAGDVLLRAFVRDGIPALRILDPHTPGRVRLQRIDAYAPDRAWVREATFTPRDEPVGFDHIDGHRSVQQRTGTLEFELDGIPTRLTATVLADALSVVFGDATNGVETFRFRFLRVPLPDEEGRTTVDFTRAILPPCSFSDHYVCPLPPPGNRLDVAVRAGERTPVRADA